MKPSDALPQDWRLYYDQSWMRHSNLGPGKVRVSGGSLYFYQFPNDEPETEGVLVRPTHLSCWWPRSGAYNFPGYAVYIARKSTRSMRKSANPHEHYTVKWSGGEYYDDGSNNKLMLLLRKGPSLVDKDFAMKVLDEGMATSIAVAHDIILAKEKAGLSVVFKGIQIGTLKDDNFVPDFDRAALVRRATDRLMQEGLL